MPYSPPRFFFFDETVGNAIPVDLNEDVRLTCVASGHGHVWFGDQNGFVHRLDRAKNVVSFRAHVDAIRHICVTKQQDLLFTVGLDQQGEERFKVWNVAKWFNRPEPFCLRNSSCTLTGQPISPVTCICVDQKLQLIVLGHANGMLQAIRGEVTRERSAKRFILHTFSETVTGLGICTAPEDVAGTGRSRTDMHSPDSSTPVIFAASTACTMSFMLGRRDEVQLHNSLDQYGGDYNCATMIKDHSNATIAQFAVVDSQAVRFYNWDGRSRCLATGDHKLAVIAFKQYLVIVRGPKGSYLSVEPFIKNTQSSDSLEQADPTEQSSVVIHDYLNHFIAGEFPIPGMTSLFVEWDSIYALCEDPTASRRYSLVCMSEKSTQAKLELLFSKKNFQLALDVAQSQKLSGEDITQIIWRYADHLYKQKEYDASIKEYVKTIGILEVSFVIQRFLEGGHIPQLAYYLEALNEADLATSDHLILLLNCYSRLQDKAKINQFVECPANPNLNVPTAIHVLRQSNFSDAALQLAKTTGHCSAQVEILVEDLDNGLEALKCVKQFPFDEALKAICTHGPLLMDRNPSETVAVLEQLCANPEASRINIHHLLRIFINNREGLLHFLQRYIEHSKVSEKVIGVTDTLLELVLHEVDRLDKEVQEAKADNPSAETQRQQLLQLALRVLQNEEFPYDEHKALLLCHQRRFYNGCVFLWKKLKLYDQLLHHYIQLDASTEVLQTCQQYGNVMPNLWLQALRYFGTKPEKSDELQQVVSEVDRHGLAPPLVVLQILSDTDAAQSCSIGAIRDYLLRHLEAGTDRINAMRKEVRQLREETMQNREVVRILSSQVKMFQQQKCVLCHQNLEPPSVHFLCDHAYHKTCFDNYAYGDQQCPECAPRNKKLLAETVNTAYNTTTSTLSMNQIVTQLRQALQLAHSTSAKLETDTPLPISSQPTSPRLTKALAHILAQGGLESGKPRLQRAQSPLSVNAVTMAPLVPRAKVTGSIKSEDSMGSIPELSAQPAQSGSMPNVEPVSVQPPVTTAQLIRELAHTGSTGYASQGTVGTQPSSKRSLNPFGESDTDEENVVRKPSVISQDPGLESLSSVQQPDTYRTPFD